MQRRCMNVEDREKKNGKIAQLIINKKGKKRKKNAEKSRRYM